MFGQKSHKLRNGFRVLAIAACAAVCFFAVSGFGREYTSAVMLRGQEKDIVLGMRAFDPHWLSFSVRGLNDLMKNCADLLLENEMVRLSPQLQQEIGDSCGAAAKAVLRRNPGFARALAAGLIAARADVTPEAYAVAEQAAPFEPWPLGIRLLAAERAVPKATGTLPAALVPLVSSDMGRAMQSDWGRRLLAGLYLRQTGLRSLIQAVAKSRPVEEQRAFLQATQHLAAANG